MATMATVLGVAAAALLAGAGNTFVTKLLITAVDCAPECAPAGAPAGAPVPFSKPIFTTLLAFSGMAASGLYYVVRHLWRRRSGGGGGGGGEALLLGAGGADGDDTDDSAEAKLPPPAAPAVVAVAGVVSRYRPLAVPSLLDVAATALQATASLFIPAAVNAVLRGSILLFTAAANRALGVRDGRAGRREWAAIGVSMAGVALVGLSSVLNSGSGGDAGGGGGGAAATTAAALSPASAAAVGVGLALLSNAVQGVQVAYETRFLEGARYAPVEANAAEGVIGAAMCVVLLAAAQVVPSVGGGSGPLEDSAQTACCVAATPAIAGVSALLFGLFAASTVAHMALSLLRGSNFRSFILCGRSLLVWGLEFAAAAASGGAVGAAWLPYSWLEAVGFAVLAAGGVGQFAAQSAREARAEADEAAAAAATEGGALELRAQQAVGGAAPPDAAVR